MESEKEETVIKKEYFKNVSIFRFIFILAIALTHTKALLDYNIPVFNHIVKHIGYSHTAVELFFVISGFFLFYTTNFKQDFYTFIKHKFIRLMPVILFVWMIRYILSWMSVIEIPKYETIWGLFCLQNIGITLNYNTIGASWFVSCVIWVSCLFFYSYKNLKKEHFNILLAAAIVFCLAYLIHSPAIGTVFNYQIFINCGMLRAISCMGIGYFLWNIYNDKLIQIKNINLFKTILITGLEGYLIVFIVQNVLFRSMNYPNYLLLVLLFSVLFLLLLIKKGFISKLLENNFSVFLGKYAYSIMISHETLRDVFKNVVDIRFKDFIINYPVLYLVIIFLSYIVFGVLIYHFVEKPSTVFLKKRYEK